MPCFQFIKVKISNKKRIIYKFFANTNLLLSFALFIHYFPVYIKVKISFKKPMPLQLAQIVILRFTPEYNGYGRSVLTTTINKALKYILKPCQKPTF